MESIKKVLHIRSKSKAETQPEASYSGEHDNRASVDEELAAMTPEERAAYLKDFEEAEKEGKPKRGSLIERLIERGNKKTEEDLKAGKGDGVVH